MDRGKQTGMWLATFSSKHNTCFDQWEKMEINRNVACNLYTYPTTGCFNMIPWYFIYNQKESNQQQIKTEHQYCKSLFCQVFWTPPPATVFTFQIIVNLRNLCTWINPLTCLTLSGGRTARHMLDDMPNLTLYAVLELSPIASQFATRKVGNCDSSWKLEQKCDLGFCTPKSG